MRPPTACQFCRSRRRRCDRESSSTKCTLCQKHNVLCVATSVSAPGSGADHTRSSSIGASNNTIQSTLPINGPASSSISLPHAYSLSQPSSLLSDITRPRSGSIDHDRLENIALPPAAVCFHLATLYFDYVHDQLHTLFHKPALIADLAMNKVPSVIMWAVVALSARFSNHDYFARTSPRARGAKYARASARLFDPSDVSLESIQAAVLLGACRIVEGDALAESVYYGIACRMAQLLDLPRRVCFSRLEREINIRVWHTLCMIDEWSSTGVQVSKQISTPAADIPLPMEEMAFIQLRHQDINDSIELDEFAASSSSSLLAQMIILNRILADINRLNQQAVDTGSMALSLDEVETLSKRLDDWEEELPYYMRDDTYNLAHYAAQGLGRIYVAVYLGYYHFGQLLFYQYLHNSEAPDSDSTSRRLAQKCKDHAAKLCDITWLAHQTPGGDVLYNMVGHVLVIASTVQIHTLLFSADHDEIVAAKRRLGHNFEILMKLRSLWPSLDYCMMRLQAFHKACLGNSRDTSFKLDRWMLKFLSEFAKPVDDRTAEGEHWIVNDIAITPVSDFGVDSII